MTRAKTPAEKAVKTSRTAAERSLKLVIEEATKALGQLGDGTSYPDLAGFLAHAQAYEKARVQLILLATLGADGVDAADDGLIEVSRDNVALLTQVVRAVVPARMLGDGGPLIELETAAGVAPPPAVPAPDGAAS